MQLRYRYRRGLYPLAEEPRFPRWIKTLITLVILAAIAYWVGSTVLRWFGVGNALVRAPALLSTEERGIVSVALQGQTDQTAEDGMALFPDDQLSTGPNAHASMRFFDGSMMRLDEKTTLTIEESARGQKESSLDVSMEKGALWISSPTARAFTGSIVRMVETQRLSFLLPPGTEAVITPSSVIVFAADGEGVRVQPASGKEFVVGEGQDWHMPAQGEIGDDPYAYRSSIDLSTVAPFVTDSRRRAQPVAAGSSGSTMPTGALTVTSPAPDMILKEPTLTVRGTVGKGIASVEVNGHPALLDQTKHTFSQEIMPPDGKSTFDVKVSAFDAQHSLVTSITRTVQHPINTKLDPPTITSPAKDGETYRTQKNELIIRGTSPKDAAAMYVNDYKLQLFSPEKGTWSYLASIALKNLKPGSNVFDVYAEDGAGTKSEPVRITILWEEGREGVVTTETPTAGASSSINPQTLPQNAPLAAGTLAVTAPTAGTEHTETGTGLLLEGTTSPKTASIWVNDYMLQLYKSGKTTWNYIASEELQNLKKGKNVYTVIARDAQNQILDTLTYTVTKE